jgi:pimeloyl-ACP methyl ester carboxylesterase
MSSDSSAEAGEQPVKLVERGVAVRGVRLASAMNDASRELLARAPLVVLPAAAFTWQAYTPILEHFGRERRVFALDWPGFGASEKPAPDAFSYSSTSYAEMLAGWMDGLGIARVVLLGNGIGATVAIRYAAAHPKRTLGLALSGPLGFGAGGRFGRLAGRALTRPALLRRLEPVRTSLALGPTTPLTTEIALRRREQRAADDYPASVAAFAALWRSLAVERDELVARAKAVTAPAIVLRGAMDALVTESDAQRAAEALGEHGGMRIELPDAGHLPFLQQPGPFLRAVAGVLNTAEANAASAS